MTIFGKGARFAAAALLAGGLAACATPTAYGPAEGGRYGYSDQQIESDRYRVTFRGNSLTERQTVENYLLFRAAELTLETGNDYFVVVQQDTERDTRTHYTTFGFGGYRYPFYYRAWGFPWAYDPYYAPYEAVGREVDRYEATATIKVYEGAPPEGDAMAYDAREVVEFLGPDIRREDAG